MASQRWRLGLFRTDEGALGTVYVTKDGLPVPYERERVGDRPIVFKAVYEGMAFRDARVKLFEDAAAAGIEGGAPTRKAPTRQRVETADGEVIFVDLDANAPRIDGCRLADGWKIKQLYINFGGKPLKDADVYDPSVATSLLIAPDGTEYVHATANEKADLIVEDPKAVEMGLGPTRLRRFESSGLAKMIRREDKLVEQGEAALAVKKQKKIKRSL